MAINLKMEWEDLSYDQRDHILDSNNISTAMQLDHWLNNNYNARFKSWSNIIEFNDKESKTEFVLKWL